MTILPGHTLQLPIWHCHHTAQFCSPLKTCLNYTFFILYKCLYKIFLWLDLNFCCPPATYDNANVWPLWDNRMTSYSLTMPQFSMYKCSDKTKMLMTQVKFGLMTTSSWILCNNQYTTQGKQTWWHGKCLVDTMHPYHCYAYPPTTTSSILAKQQYYPHSCTSIQSQDHLS